MKVDVAYQHAATKELEELYGLQQVPKKRYEDRAVYTRVYEVWRTKLADVVTFHHTMHASEEKNVILNIDGVPLGRTGRSQLIVSVKFATCRNIYQVTNAVPFGAFGKKYMTVTFVLGDVLKSVRDLGLNLKYICADAPMRAFLRNQKTHTSKLGCDYCYGEAGHQGRPIWGLETIHSKERTISSLKEDYEAVQAGKKAFSDFGYKGRSEVLDMLPDFDLISDIPVDPLHLLYLGVGRALFELLFAVGETRPTMLNSAPLSTRQIDGELVCVKVPTELPRRPRAMDFKNWKASEWRNLILFYFPIVAHFLPAGPPRDIWLDYCFICRAFSVDDEYFEQLDVDDLKSRVHNWYTMYYNTFGSLNMRYNVHLLAHLFRIRVHGAFPLISAFGFEGSFAASSKAQHVGTSSEGLQSMRHSYLRPMRGHLCEKNINLSTQTTARRQDDLVYSGTSCFELCETPKDSDTFLKVRKVNLSTYFAPGGANTNWTTVGVFKYISTISKQQYVRRSQIRGKLIRVPLGHDYILVTISNAQLREAD